MQKLRIFWSKWMLIIFWNKKGCALWVVCLPKNYFTSTCALKVFVIKPTLILLSSISKEEYLYNIFMIITINYFAFVTQWVMVQAFKSDDNTITGKNSSLLSDRSLLSFWVNWSSGTNFKLNLFLWIVLNWN